MEKPPPFKHLQNGNKQQVNRALCSPDLVQIKLFLLLCVMGIRLRGARAADDDDAPIWIRKKEISKKKKGKISEASKSRTTTRASKQAKGLSTEEIYPK